MDASEFKNYILGIIFYRFLSERVEKCANEILVNDGMTMEEAYETEEFRNVLRDSVIGELGYIIEPQYLFRTFVQKITKPKNDSDKFSVEDLEKGIKALSLSVNIQAEHAFKDLFSDIRLNDTRLGDSVNERTKMISRVITSISNVPFTVDDAEFDILGTAYMILIGLFASDAGKKGGEFFTPECATKLCAKIAAVGLDQAETVGDCTCGSASMLLSVKKYLKKHNVGHFYGQEFNASTYNLARMNMLMHGIPFNQFNIYKGDTLTDDKYKDLKLTIQVCNPPYSLSWNPSKAMEDDARYSGAGRLAPKTKADWAFVEHMVYHMADDGRIVVLLPHGVLFRSGAEEQIRKYIGKTLNKIDAIIGLPANLFHGTGIPVCLMILKNKRNGNSGNVMFIDASKDFVSGKKQNQITDEQIDKIINTYVERKDVEKYAHVASLEEIDENDWNLNIPRYVDTSEEEERIDLDEVRKQILEVQKEKKLLLEKINKSFKELGLDGIPSLYTEN